MALGRPIRVALEARLWRDEKAAGRSSSYGQGLRLRGLPVQGHLRSRSNRPPGSSRRLDDAWASPAPPLLPCGRSSAMKLHENLPDRLLTLAVGDGREGGSLRVGPSQVLAAVERDHLAGHRGSVKDETYRGRNLFRAGPAPKQR